MSRTPYDSLRSILLGEASKDLKKREVLGRRDELLPFLEDEVKREDFFGLCGTITGTFRTEQEKWWKVKRDAKRRATSPLDRFRHGKIVLSANQYETVGLLLKALAENDRVYRVGSDLVRIVQTTDAEGRPSSMLEPFKAESIGTELNRTHQTFQVTQGEEVAVPLSMTHCKAVLADVTQGDFRMLDGGLRRTPTLQRDGRLVTSKGYDPSSRTYTVDHAPDLDIPDRLTMQHARDAYEKIAGLLVDWRFRHHAGESAVVSMFMTVAARDVIRGPVPAFLIDAVEAENGKSLMATCAGIVGMGQHPPKVIWGNKNEDQLNKLIDLALIQGGNPEMLLLDNAENGAVIRSAYLDGLITGGDGLMARGVFSGNAVTFRPLRATFVVTGNGVTVAEDTKTRFIPITVYQEGPARRKVYKLPQLDKKVQARWEELHAAALTILAAYLQSGEKVQLDQRTRFPAWNETVASALVWLGAANPCATREQFESASDADEPFGHLVEFAYHHFGDRPWRAGQLREALVQAESGSSRWSMYEVRNTLEALALMDEKGSPSDIQPNKLGRWLSKRVPKAHGVSASTDRGFYLERIDADRNGTEYAVRRHDEVLEQEQREGRRLIRIARALGLNASGTNDELRVRIARHQAPGLDFANRPRAYLEALVDIAENAA